MARKIFLKLYERSYFGFEFSQNINFDLDSLFESFDLTNEWIRIRRYEDGWVTIWDQWDIKQQKDKNFIFIEDKKKYNEEYAKYLVKNWEEIPKLEITENNYKEILDNWEKIKKDKRKYLIISMDDFGWVNIESKDDLLPQDEEYMKKDYERFLNYRKKYEENRLFCRGKNKEWESSNDDEYYSDFLTDEEMVWKRKKF